jgi:hypothetical protein
VVYAQNDLELIMTAYAQGEAEKHELGLFIAMKGADPIIEPEQVYTWH